jgi:glucose uptake protein GlcU
MSTLFAIINTASATPVATPEVVVRTVVQTVTVVPDWIKQTAALGLFLVPGYFASFLHSLADAKIGLTRWANAIVLFTYSAILGVLGLIAAGQLDLMSVNLHSPEAVGTAIMAVIGAASARYALLKARSGASSTSTTPEVTTEAPVAL